MNEVIKVDKNTTKWFEQHPEAVTTLMMCEMCGLYYKPSLGHTCENKTTWEDEKDKVPSRKPMKYEDILERKDIMAGLEYLRARAHTIRQVQIIDMIMNKLKERERE